jgi:hypothetical protein
MADPLKQPIVEGKPRRRSVSWLSWCTVAICAVLVATFALSLAKASNSNAGPGENQAIQIGAEPTGAGRTSAAQTSTATNNKKPVGSACAPGPKDAARTSCMVIDRKTGETLLSKDPNAQYRSASLVKLLIAIDIVIKDPDPDPRLARMLSMSDDNIASILWVRDGGPAIVTRTAREIGLKHTEPPKDGGRWGDTLITAADIVTVYQYILKLPRDKQSLLLNPLRGATRLGADGFNQYFGIPVALDSWQWAIKQGWAAGHGATDAHTSGLVGENDRYIVVVLTSYTNGMDVVAASRAVTTKTATIIPLLEPPAKPKR